MSFFVSPHIHINVFQGFELISELCDLLIPFIQTPLKRLQL